DVGSGAVEAHERVARILAGVAHVAEQIALRILCAGPAHVQTQAPEAQAGVLLAPLLHGNTAYDLEAAAGLDLVAPARDLVLQLREREVVRAQIAERAPGAARMCHGAAQLVDVIRHQHGAPARRVGHVGPPPRRAATDRSGRGPLVRAVEIMPRLL